MSTINDFAEGYVSRILKSANPLDTYKKIIQEVNGLRYTGGVISTSDRVAILKRIKTGITSQAILKEAQESGMLMSTIDTVAEFLKPVVQEVSNDIQETENSKG